VKPAGKWALGAALTAAAAFAAYQSASAPTPEAAPQSIAVSEPAALTEPPPTEQLPCAYQWAHQDDPALSAEFDASIKSLNPAASGRAQAFGENCVSADGASTFGAMETDFYVRLPVEDLTQEEAFGNWMAQVMEVVVEIPREKLQGPNYGFVEFTFEKSEPERVVVRVPIQQYLNEAAGKTGAELFGMFYVP
jgi:hypothetical protein